VILEGNALEMLETLEPESVDACVTSPPYWNLRDYQGAPVAWPEVRFQPATGLPELVIPAQTVQLGLESDPWAFVGHLLLIFRGVRRVLRPEGTLLLNLGDSYAGYHGNKNAAVPTSATNGWVNGVNENSVASSAGKNGLKAKDLVGIPWRVALALQADGWVLRQDIIHSKPNPSPESVVDRCTRAHEYVFLLSRKQRYYWDWEAIAERSAASLQGETRPDPGEQAGSERPDHGPARLFGSGDRTQEESEAASSFLPGTPSLRPQRRRALELARKGNLSEAHLQALRSVGTSDAGQSKALQSGSGKNTPEVQRLAREAKAVLGGYSREFLIREHRNRRSVWTIPVTPFKEAHSAVMSRTLVRDLILASTPPGGTVLDPFLGSGTTLREAGKLGRECVGIELNAANVQLIHRLHRRTQPGLGFL